MLYRRSRSLSLAAFVVLSAVTVPALAATTVVPAGLANTLGNGQSTQPLRNYGTGGSRFQQVYSASLFPTYGAVETITAVSFRAKQPTFGSFIGNSVTVSDILVRLSTTSANDAVALSPIFADNLGTNLTTVYAGSLTLTTPSAGTTAFGYVINFKDPFFYRKADGNLLLDILIPDAARVSGNGSIGFSQFDTFTDAFPSADGIGTATGATGSATIGSNSTLGVVTAFTTDPTIAIPEPAGLGLLALAGLVTLRRR